MFKIGFGCTKMLEIGNGGGGRIIHGGRSLVKNATIYGTSMKRRLICWKKGAYI